MKSLSLRFVSGLCIVVLSFVIYFCDFAYADHSLGHPCSACHSLKSTNIIVGSRSIDGSNPRLDSPPNPYVAGGPFDCSFCHKDAGDISVLFSSGNFLPLPKNESSHPVDVFQSGDQDNAPNEIVCADCHRLDDGAGGYNIAPLGLSGPGAKDDKDGYPNHKNIIPNYYPYAQADSTPCANYPEDASNKAHLTRAYGKISSSDPNRQVPWLGKRAAGTVGSKTYGELSWDKLLCFLCHDDVNNAAGITLTGVRASLSYSIEEEYNYEPNMFFPGVNTKGTAGHVILTAGGSLEQGTKMPCYNCHESHSGINPQAPSERNLKLIRITDNPYNNSTFKLPSASNPNSFVDNPLESGTNYNDQDVCDGCHNTKLAATAVGSANGITVEGLAPVDPYYGPKAAVHINANGGSAPANIRDGMTCLAGNGGCHQNSHNPKATPDKDYGTKCWNCHGDIAAAIPVKDNNNNHGWGRGGDFGVDTTTDNEGSVMISSHNIDFSSSSPGGDGSIAGKDRGSCTVCHTVEKRSNEVSYHGDGDPRNDFRDNVDPAGSGEVTYTTDPSKGFVYDPPWLFCVQCHDNESESSSADNYVGIIGISSKIAPLNLDELLDINRTNKYVYGSGDIYNINYDDANDIEDGAGFADKMSTPLFGTDNNATPVKRYNLQPYKAHYYQTKLDGSGNFTVEPTNINPENSGYNAYIDEFNSTLNNRIINCLDCHYGHGSKHSFLYRSPDSTHAPTVVFDKDDAGYTGREICLDCHRTTGSWSNLFPQADAGGNVGKVQLNSQGDVIPTATVSRIMWEPPATDRYLQAIPEHTDGVTSCTSASGSTFKCHNTHSPSCETCHAYPANILGVDR